MGAAFLAPLELANDLGSLYKKIKITQGASWYMHPFFY